MHHPLTWQKTLLWVTIYSIGMAFLESAVVIYLREIYYPFGFDFPLAPIDRHIAITELGREAGTIIMLLAIGFLAGRTPVQRFAYFILSFGIWDIFYYVFLKAVLNWPESLLTWDILFLIPTTWVGPVIAPVIISFLMIFLAVYIVRREGRGYVLRMPAHVWVLLVAGSLVLILAFIWDYSGYMIHKHDISVLWTWPGNEALYESAYEYVPRRFNWWIFSASLLLIGGGIVETIRQSWKAE